MNLHSGLQFSQIIDDQGNNREENNVRVKSMVSGVWNKLVLAPLCFSWMVKGKLLDLSILF